MDKLNLPVYRDPSPSRDYTVRRALSFRLTVGAPGGTFGAHYAIEFQHKKHRTERLQTGGGKGRSGAYASVPFAGSVMHLVAVTASWGTQIVANYCRNVIIGKIGVARMEVLDGESGCGFLLAAMRGWHNAIAIRAGSSS